MSIISNARKIAARKGITKSHLCSVLGYGRSYFIDLEKTGRDVPEEKVPALAEALGVSVDYLLGMELAESQGETRSLDFSDILDATLKRKGISQRELTEGTGIARNSVTYWRQHRNIPNPRTLERIAEYLDVSVDYLLGREPGMEKAPAGNPETAPGLLDGLTDSELAEVRTFVAYLKSRRGASV